ncbi:MAG: transposase [Gammaproteobacteria bacterium]|nr:transposase [Gammaproteobacteria bacterium]
MARSPRIVVPGQPMHIVHRGNDRNPIFFTNRDYYVYLKVLREAAIRYECDIHAYVLMTNHVHMLMTPHSKEGPSRCVQMLGNKYVRYINGIYQRTGTLWEGRFKSALIDSENYLLMCYRYIELNPVRANMVSLPGNYWWSSYRCNALGQENMLLTPHAVYMGLGSTDVDRRQLYQGLFSGCIDKDNLQLIRKSTRSGLVVGNDVFKEKIAEVLRRKVIKCDHGGDRRSEGFQEL